MDEPKTGRILVVEDSELQLMALKRVLEEAGYEVLKAANGMEAARAALAERPDLVITDVLMPEMDGFEMCSRFKSDEALRSIPVLILSQLTGPEDIIRGLGSGADGYITKPFDPGSLLAKVRNLIARHDAVSNNPADKCVEIDYRGRHYEIRSGRAQALIFLLDTYENAVIQNRELARVQDELRSLNERLEEKVRERTAALTAEIAERSSAEQVMKSSEERFRALVEAASDAVVCLEPPDIIYLWNGKAVELFGFSREEAVGRNLHDLIVPERYRKKAAAALKRFFATGDGSMIGSTVEVEALKRDGAEFPVEVSIAAFRIGGTWNSVGIIRDMTGRKRLEEDLRQNLEDVERMNRLMVGRELKMEELRDEVRKLRARVKELESGGGKTPA